MKDFLAKAVSTLSVKHEYTYQAQLTETGLSVNIFDAFSKLIKDAARCNYYNCDIYYDIKDINERFERFDGEFEPKYIGFRKMGVDSNTYIYDRLQQGEKLYNAYFAFYSVEVENEGCGFYKVIFKEYSV